MVAILVKITLLVSFSINTGLCKLNRKVIVLGLDKHGSTCIQSIYQGMAENIELPHDSQ